MRIWRVIWLYLIYDIPFFQCTLHLGLTPTTQLLYWSLWVTSYLTIVREIQGDLEIIMKFLWDRHWIRWYFSLWKLNLVVLDKGCIERESAYLLLIKVGLMVNEEMDIPWDHIIKVDLYLIQSFTLLRAWLKLLQLCWLCRVNERVISPTDINVGSASIIRYLWYGWDHYFFKYLRYWTLNLVLEDCLKVVYIP